MKGRARLSSVQQEASSVGIKEAASCGCKSCFLWLLKDNLHWELTKSQRAACLSVIRISRQRLSRDCPRLYLHMMSPCARLVRRTLRPGRLFPCYCRTRQRSCALNSCLSDRIQPLICSLRGTHEYYLSVHSRVHPPPPPPCQRGGPRLNSQLQRLKYFN